MMRLLTLGALIPLALTLSLTQARALSCMPADPVAAFSVANAAVETYIVVRGRFSGGPGPREGGGAEPEPRRYTATFEGVTLSANGPLEPAEREVTIEETCAGPWCAELAMGEEVLTFLQIDTGGAPLLRVSPCYGSLFFQPTEAQIEAIQYCFEVGCTAS
ncbi:MAG: hypothetical protein AAF748_07040 [Pseudomonadota bacterium]